MSYPKFHDRSAVALKLRAGNTDAFQYILDEYGPALCFFASRLTGNAAAATEIAEEAVLQLWEMRKRFYSLTAISNFLYTSTYDGCRLHLQKEQRVIDNDQIHQEIIRAEVLRQVRHKKSRISFTTPDTIYSIQPC